MKRKIMVGIRVAAGFNLELIHAIFVVMMYGRNDNLLRFMLGHSNQFLIWTRSDQYRAAFQNFISCNISWCLTSMDCLMCVLLHEECNFYIMRMHLSGEHKILVSPWLTAPCFNDNPEIYSYEENSNKIAN